MESLTLNQQELLEKIRHHLVMLGTQFRIRLVKENNWSTSFAQQVINEYAKFLFIAREGGSPVSPPPLIDKVWHLHLLHTEAYWGDLCPNILRMQLSHSPHTGVPGESIQFKKWFDQTLTSYKKFFGVPSAIWTEPDPARFRKGVRVLAILFLGTTVGLLLAAFWIGFFSIPFTILIGAMLIIGLIFYYGSQRPISSVSKPKNDYPSGEGSSCGSSDSNSESHGHSSGGDHGGGHSCGGHSCGGGH